MKFRTFVCIILVALCISGTVLAVSSGKVDNEPTRLETPLDFIFTPPFAGCLNTYNGSAYPNMINPYFTLNAFLDEYGYGTINPTYYQNTCLCLLDADAWGNGNVVNATNTLYTGTTPNTTQFFTYNTGYGPGSGNEVTICGYPANYSFTAYGINFDWRT